MTTLRQFKIAETMRLLGANRKFGSGYMHAGFKALGATMNERRGDVNSWIASKSPAALDCIIENIGGDVAAITAAWQAQVSAEMHRGMVE